MMSCPAWYWFSVWLMLTEMKDKGGGVQSSPAPPPHSTSLTLSGPSTPALVSSPFYFPSTADPPFPSYPHPPGTTWPVPTLPCTWLFQNWVIYRFYCTSHPTVWVLIKSWEFLLSFSLQLKGHSWDKVWYDLQHLIEENFAKYDRTGVQNW